MKQSGGFQLRVAVRDSASHRVGASGQFINVPNLNNSQLALSGIVLNSDPADSDVEKDDESQNDFVLRRFHPGASLVFGYTIYNAGLHKTIRLPLLKTRTLVFRDGENIYSSDPQPVDGKAQADTKRISTGARLQLGPALTRGEYAMQIVVEDKISKSTATQWTQFEVVK